MIFAMKWIGGRNLRINLIDYLFVWDYYSDMK